MQPVLTIVAGALAFGTTVWAVYRFVRSAFPTASPNLLGAGLVAAGIWLLAFRLFVMALFLIAAGALMLAPGHAARTRSAGPQTSRVRSAHLEMTLDHESGEIEGRILGGPRDGQLLSDLSLHELLQFLSEVRSDEQSLKLLETYLDRAHPGWHEHADPSAGDDETTLSDPNRMSREEACRVLGLEPGATRDDIREAYRRLIKRLHPDSGGSAVLTAQITAARDRLLDEP